MTASPLYHIQLTISPWRAKCMILSESSVRSAVCQIGIADSYITTFGSPICLVVQRVKKRKWLKTRQNLAFAQPYNLVAFLIHYAGRQRQQALIVTLNCGCRVSVIRILRRTDLAMGEKSTPSSQSSIRGCCCCC